MTTNCFKSIVFSYYNVMFYHSKCDMSASTALWLCLISITAASIYHILYPKVLLFDCSILLVQSTLDQMPDKYYCHKYLPHFIPKWVHSTVDQMCSFHLLGSIILVYFYCSKSHLFYAVSLLPMYCMQVGYMHLSIDIVQLNQIDSPMSSNWYGTVSSDHEVAS